MVFEPQNPECTPLYNVPVKKNSLVAPKAGKLDELYRVTAIDGDKIFCVRDKENFSFDRADLISVAQFGEEIYPYLQPLDAVCNAPDSPLWHALIEADNFHALQLLKYLYGGKVDCIYIYPPYNTGARDWKYNNDYVDAANEYRHSKWLAMMERRLLLAKELLNPRDSVLIVTIDEHEDEFIAYGRSLGLGMNWEGDHVDIALDGTQWDGNGENAGDFNPRNGATRADSGEKTYENTYDTSGFTPRQIEIWGWAQYASKRAKDKWGITLAPEMIYKQWSVN